MADVSDPVATEDQRLSESEIIETREWLESIDYVLQEKGPERVRTLLEHMQIHLRRQGMELPFSANTPYINTIPAHRRIPFPGSRAMERRIKSLVRWNAMAMVVRGLKVVPLDSDSVTTARDMGISFGD